MLALTMGLSITLGLVNEDELDELTKSVIDEDELDELTAVGQHLITSLHTYGKLVPQTPNGVPHPVFSEQLDVQHGTSIQ
jgi:hypothetical protein